MLLRSRLFVKHETVSSQTLNSETVACIPAKYIDYRWTALPVPVLCRDCVCCKSAFLLRAEHKHVVILCRAMTTAKAAYARRPCSVWLLCISSSVKNFARISHHSALARYQSCPVVVPYHNLTLAINWCSSRLWHSFSISTPVHQFPHANDTSSKTSSVVFPVLGATTIGTGGDGPPNF